MPKVSNVPPSLDWEVYAGDRNDKTFEFTAGDPVDLTGAVLTAQARASAKDPAVAMDAVVTLTEPALGRFTIEWPGEGVRGVLAGADSWVGVWDVQMQLGAAEPESLLRGRWSAFCDVTRAEAGRG